MSKMTAMRAAIGGLLMSTAANVYAPHLGVVVMDMDVTARLANAEERRQELHAKALAIVEGLGEGEDLTDEQNDEVQELTAEVEKLDKRIATLKALAPKPGQGRKTLPDPKDKTGGGSVLGARPKDNKHGFENFGDFATAVHRAEIGNSDAMQKLQNAATTYSSEGSGADGGWLVPPEFRREIAEKVAGEGSLIDRSDRLVTSSNALVLPKDETTPWQNSGGIQAYWEDEGATGTESKLKFEQNMVRLHKMRCLVKATDELLGDAALLDSYLRRRAPVKMQAKLNTAIISGTGAGQPLGILNSGSLVTVNAAAGQAADTVVFDNIVQMEARLYTNDMTGVCWLINQNILPSLMSMQFVTGATSPVPAWLPANGLAGQRFSTLMGKPVIPVQACPKLGDIGDIILADMKQYMTATKGQDIKVDISIHLHFDQDIQTYRFVFRVAGQPWWTNSITPQTASEALGSFVAIAAR